MAADKPQDDPTIAEYRARKKEFQPAFAKAFLAFAPGFVLFAVGDGDLSESWLARVGLALALVGLAFMMRAWYTHLRCPVCEAVQGTEWRFPFRTCASCGARLSVGARD